MAATCFSSTHMHLTKNQRRVLSFTAHRVLLTLNSSKLTLRLPVAGPPGCKCRLCTPAGGWAAAAAGHAPRQKPLRVSACLVARMAKPAPRRAPVHRRRARTRVLVLHPGQLSLRGYCGFQSLTRHQRTCGIDGGCGGACCCFFAGS